MQHPDVTKPTQQQQQPYGQPPHAQPYSPQGPGYLPVAPVITHPGALPPSQQVPQCQPPLAQASVSSSVYPAQMMMVQPSPQQQQQQGYYYPAQQGYPVAYGVPQYPPPQQAQWQGQPVQGVPVQQPMIMMAPDGSGRQVCPQGKACPAQYHTVHKAEFWHGDERHLASYWWS